MLQLTAVNAKYNWILQIYLSELCMIHQENKQKFVLQLNDNEMILRLAASVWVSEAEAEVELSAQQPRYKATTGHVSGLCACIEPQKTAVG